MTHPITQAEDGAAVVAAPTARPLYDAARLAYGAADALLSAETWGREPILSEKAAGFRANARQALVDAINQLDAAA